MDTVKKFELYDILLSKVSQNAPFPSKDKIKFLTTEIKSERLPHDYTYAIILQHFSRTEKTSVANADASDLPYKAKLDSDRFPVLKLARLPARLTNMLLEYAIMNEQRLTNDLVFRKGGAGNCKADGKDKDRIVSKKKRLVFGKTCSGNARKKVKTDVESEADEDADEDEDEDEDVDVDVDVDADAVEEESEADEDVDVDVAEEESEADEDADAVEEESEADEDVDVAEEESEADEDVDVAEEESEADEDEDVAEEESEADEDLLDLDLELNLADEEMDDEED
jgi:hypothetical protein